MLETRIKEMRLKNKLTMLQLGKLVNIGESTISLYESGKRQPSYSVLKKMSVVFNCSIDYLLGNTDDPAWPSEKTDQPEISDKDIMFALFNGDIDEITEEMYEDVKQYAQFIRERKRKSNN